MKEGKGTKEADQAILDASKDKIEAEEMIQKIIEAQVFVPLPEPPLMDGDKMKSWQPATVSHPDRGDFLVAFTDEDTRDDFVEKNPDYRLGMMLPTKFLVTILPPNHGILFNINGDSCFEWERRGILAYQQSLAMKKNKN